MTKTLARQLAAQARRYGYSDLGAGQVQVKCPRCRERITTGRNYDALASAWSDIRRRHRLVPRAVVVRGPEKACGAVNWAEEPVIMVGQQTLGNGKPDEVLHALLHQAAHGVAGGTSASSAGRWHDVAFDAAAASMGLEAVPGARQGWHGSTRMPDATRDRYPAALETLAAALADEPGTLAGFSRNGIVATCGCPEGVGLRIRIRGSDAASQLDNRPIVCSVCGERFTPEVSR